MFASRCDEDARRTTIGINDDVLARAKELARQRGVSLGAVVASESRRAFTQKSPHRVIWKKGLPVISL
jgi:hypothetical protein